MYPSEDKVFKYVADTATKDQEYGSIGRFSVVSCRISVLLHLLLVLPHPFFLSSTFPSKILYASKTFAFTQAWLYYTTYIWTKFAMLTPMNILEVARKLYRFILILLIVFTIIEFLTCLPWISCLTEVFPYLYISVKAPVSYRERTTIIYAIYSALSICVIALIGFLIT